MYFIFVFVCERHRTCNGGSGNNSFRGNLLHSGIVSGKKVTLYRRAAVSA